MMSQIPGRDAVGSPCYNGGVRSTRMIAVASDGARNRHND